MRLSTSSVFLACAIAVLAGCSSTPPVTEAPKAAAPAAVAKPAEPAPAAKPAPAAPAQAAAKAIAPYLDPNNPLSKQRSVYFDYDDFSIKKDFQSVMELHGKYLAQNPSVSIRVEGNADERGGAEYNLALGQKRADAVAAALKVYGVSAKQVEATSWGKEKPKATGHDEASWAENRRGDLVYPKQ